MCGSSIPLVPKKPKTPIIEAPEAPPPPEETPTAPVVEGPGRSASGQRAAKRTGIRGLRIDLNVAQPGGSGLNIPRA